MTKPKLKPIAEEGDDIEEAGTNIAAFLLSDGKRTLRVKAEKDCWSISRWSDAIDTSRTDGIKGWVPFKWVNDIGMVAGRFFEWRLKNSDCTTLQELSARSKQLRLEIRKEFQLEPGITR